MIERIRSTQRSSLSTGTLLVHGQISFWGPEYPCGRRSWWQFSAHAWFQLRNPDGHVSRTLALVFASVLRQLVAFTGLQVFKSEDEREMPVQAWGTAGRYQDHTEGRAGVPADDALHPEVRTVSHAVP